MPASTSATPTTSGRSTWGASEQITTFSSIRRGSSWNERCVEAHSCKFEASASNWRLDHTNCSSVTRLGDFWKFLGTKFLEKVAQILSNNFGLLWKMALFMLNWCEYFLGNFCRKLGYILLQHLITLQRSWKMSNKFFQIAASQVCCSKKMKKQIVIETIFCSFQQQQQQPHQLQQQQQQH